jgi:sec-independent protein translocase protein TatA
MHSLVLGFLNIGSSEMILIVFAALLLFGGEKLPEIARGLGKGIRDFKDASEGVKREINNQINSYEEKRQDDLLTEKAIEIQQATAQNELPAHHDGFAPVENTIPVSDGFSTLEHPVAGETHTEEHNLPVIAEHTVVPVTEEQHVVPVIAEHHAIPVITEEHVAVTDHDAVTSVHTKNT